ncbi:MAG: Crp/Fnr family transcriptional regulator, partial [Humibacillus sp.]|nr:Crp/Fnr family transcriptional regulator [Humibacillus sp.]
MSDTTDVDQHDPDGEREVVDAGDLPEIDDLAPEVNDADQKLLDVLHDVGRLQTFASGEFVSEQGAPREWFGVLRSGELELLHGRHGDPRRVGMLQKGAMVFEGALMQDDTPHSLSSRSIGPVEMLVVDTAAIDRLRAQHPDVWSGLMLRVAQRLRARLRVATAHLADHGESLEPIGTTRLEKDSLGVRE